MFIKTFKNHNDFTDKAEKVDAPQIIMICWLKYFNIFFILKKKKVIHNESTRCGKEKKKEH